MSTELERQTRKRRIDPRLKAAGWRVLPFVQRKPLEEYGDGAAVEEFETSNGPADYALCDRGQVRGVVEAKKVTLGPQGVLSELTAREKSSSVHLSKAARAIARFRQSVLAAACSGRLTAAWRGSEDLVGWHEVRLDEVCESITDGDHQAPPQAASGIPFITIAAMNDGQLRLDRATRFVPSSYYEGLKAARRPRPGDVLFSVTGSIGIPAIVDSGEMFTFQRHIAILRPDTTRMFSQYLLHALGTAGIREQALAVATGTAQLTIPLAGLRSFVIALPGIAEQAEVVRRVDQLLTVANELQRRVETAERGIDRTSQAVLGKAFRGDLVSKWECSAKGEG